MKKPHWFWLALVTAVALYYLLRSLSAIFFPFVLGLIGAYAFDGPTNRLMKYKLSRGLASGLVVLGVLFTLVILMMVFIPFIHQQIISLALNAPGLLDSWLQELKPWIDSTAKQFGTKTSAVEVKKQLTEHFGDVFGLTLKLLSNLLTNGMALANLLSLVILTPIIMFYLLRDWPKFIDSIYSNIPIKYRENTTLYARRIDDTLSDYAKGQMKVCLILMLIYATALRSIGLEHGIFVGIMTGFLAFIPYVGMLMGLLAALASSFAHFYGWDQIGYILIIFTVTSLLEGNFLSPRFIGERVGLNPVWIIFSLLAGATWFGFIGVLFALPMAAIIGVIVRISIEWYKSSSVFTSQSKGRKKAHAATNA